jgi:hypothetical protein
LKPPWRGCSRPANSSKLLTLAVAGILLGLWSCAPVAPQSFGLSDGPSPRGRSPKELVRELSQKADRFQSLRSLAEVYYWTKEEKGGFPGVVLVRRPDRLRLETLSPMGAVLIVTADSKEVVGFHLRKGIFYRGRSSKKNLRRYIQVPLELRDLTSLLMGLPPMESRGPWRQEGNSVRWLLSGGRSEVVSFDPAMGDPIRWKRVNPEGRTEISATFSGFHSTPAGKFPLRISLETEVPERRFEIRYQEPELNPPLPSALFVQQRPVHVREVPLDSLGG